MRAYVPGIFAILISGVSLIPGGTGDLQAQKEQRCFEATGFCISGRFRTFWETHGGLAVFGYPISPQQEEMIEGIPYQVQWFERTRMELHPENAPPHDVLLGRLGAEEVARNRRATGAQGSTEEPREGCLYFAATGRNVCGDILQHFRAHGLEFDGQPGLSIEENVALFGLPLTTVIPYTTNGREYDGQCFERARFELHPSNAPPYHVQLGLLGVQILAQQDQHHQQEPPPNETLWCQDVPGPVNARIRPDQCIRAGAILQIDIFGFAPDEYVGYWLTAPDDSIVGSKETFNIGEEGKVSNIPLNTEDFGAGLWTLVFEGTTSGHLAIVYFKVT